MFHVEHFFVCSSKKLNNLLNLTKKQQNLTLSAKFSLKNIKSIYTLIYNLNIWITRLLKYKQKQNFL